MTCKLRYVLRSSSLESYTWPIVAEGVRRRFDQQVRPGPPPWSTLLVRRITQGYTLLQLTDCC